jgi:hypothetical protein
VDFNHKYRPSRKMTKSQYEMMMNGEKTITDKEKYEEIEKHMKERGKLIINVLFNNNYLLIFRIFTVGTLKRLV